MKQHYLILSSGAYSDYLPIYFVGKREITQEEFEKKGIEIGDKVIQEWEDLPERKHECKSEQCCCFNKIKTEKYHPDGKLASSYPNAGEWFDQMKEWILSQGFQELPDEIPELNASYSDFPNSKTITS